MPPVDISTPLPPQKVVLLVTLIKIQLICKYLQDIAEQLPGNGRKLAITGPNPASFEIHMGRIVETEGLQTTHEEADVITVQQVAYLASAGSDTIQVICNDTDVFVLLIHYYSSQNFECELSMVSTCSSRSTVDIKASMEKKTRN